MTGQGRGQPDLKLSPLSAEGWTTLGVPLSMNYVDSLIHTFSPRYTS